MTEVFIRVLWLSASGTLVALGVKVACTLLGHRLSQTWRYYIWLIVLARLALPFAPPGQNLVDLAVRQATTPSAVQGRQNAPDIDQNPELESVTLASYTGMAPTHAGGLPEAPESENVEIPATTASPRHLLMELWRYAWVAWLGVALMLSVRIITSYHSFTRFIRAGWQPVDDPAMLDMLDAVCRAQGLRKPPPLYLNPLASSPMLVGILRPVIVLPSTVLSPENLRHVLAHELVHHRRRDILYKWFVQVVACLHWFNPMVYFVRKEINVACELSCDERVLSLMEQGRHRQYGDTLLAVIQTSGHYGDTVASVTMSEEGKMMKKRLLSISNPHKKSKATALLSVAVCLVLLVGAAYAGAYSGPEAPAAVAEATAMPEVTPLAEVTPVPEPTPIPFTTDQPTAGQQLDRFLGDVEELAGSFGEHAQEWGESFAEKATEWGETWGSSWAEHFESGGMFSHYLFGDRQMINEGFYLGGYITHLRYDSAAQSSNQSVVQLGSVSLVLPIHTTWEPDDATLNTLRQAVDAFAARHPGLALEEGTLFLVSMEGPYEGSADELLWRFYNEENIENFAAVLRSGKTSEDERKLMLKDAARINRIAYFAVLLTDDITTSTADELLQYAYDNSSIALFSMLLDYASPELRQSLRNQAVLDGKVSFVAVLEEDISVESIESMLATMGDQLDPAMISFIVDDLTPEQALRIAEQAYVQENIAVFSIVMDELDDEEIARFHELAHQDQNTAFYAVTMP